MVHISDSHCKGMLPGPHLQGYGDKVARRNRSLWFYLMGYAYFKWKGSFSSAFNVFLLMKQYLAL